MFFSDIIGQEAARDQLLSAVEQNRLSHAMILLAPEGAGGLPVGLAFAQYLVCENRQAGDSCGQCSACKKSRAIHSS